MLAERLADLGEDVEIRYPDHLLPRQRFVADHKGEPDFTRTADEEQSWRELLRETDIVLGIPGDSPDGFRELFEGAPDLRWVQGTAAGTGEQLLGARADADVLAKVAVTSAAGLHAAPLAEFAVFGLLAMAKDLDRIQEHSRRREWAPRWPMRQLAGSNIAVLGLGGVGREVSRLLGAFGATVYGVHRGAPKAPVDGVTVNVPIEDLDEILPVCDAVVAALPGTSETRGLIDADRLRLLPNHAVVVNVGRGSVIDSAALVAAPDAGHLRGAALDVTEVEPLPADSSLWDRPNVILSPHTAALTVDEDVRIVDLFAANVRRFVAGQPLLNLVEVDRGY